MIECRCKTDLGYFSLFVGCKWKLVYSNCPSVLFCLADDSAPFDSSFDDLIYTGDSDENPSQNMTSLEVELETLTNQQLIHGKSRFNNL